ncbi:hypothetical protein VF02_02105 [Nostoc linckia z1]|nr:hypothetical protein VF02_02105 [Nostoc linckia z1]
MVRSQGIFSFWALGIGHWALGINTVRFVHFQLGIWFWEKVSQRGLGGFPHERLANPEGVKG